jgi:hypothetical protein
LRTIRSLVLSDLQYIDVRDRLDGLVEKDGMD